MRVGVLAPTLASASWHTRSSTTSVAIGSGRGAPDTAEARVHARCPRQPAQRVGQRAAVELRGGQVVHQDPRLGQVLPGGPGREVQVPARARMRAVQVGLGRLDQHEDAGEALGQRVVDIGGEPLPLGHPSGLVLRGRQLVLGRLELVDDPGPLRALLDDP